MDLRVWKSWLNSRRTPARLRLIGSGCSDRTLKKADHCNLWRWLPVFRSVAPLEIASVATVDAGRFRFVSTSVGLSAEMLELKPCLTSRASSAIVLVVKVDGFIDFENTPVI